AATILCFLTLDFVVPSTAKGRLFGLTAAGIVVFSFIMSASLMSGRGQRIPHVPDELAYIFEARLLASGHLAAPPPPVEAAFQWSNPQPVAVNHGKWATIYPIGHPLALAVGIKLGAMWLVTPFLGAAT